MTISDYIEAIKLELTGGILELEIDDSTLEKVVNKAFREIQRYIDTSKFVTVPYVPCIDLSTFDYSSIVHVYRTEGYAGDGGSYSSTVDPMFAERWMAFSSGGTMYNLQNYLLNYASYNTLLQMRNTSTTDLAYIEDKQANKLYINVGYDKPPRITIEYIPKYVSVDQITSDYWIDVLQRLSIASTKIILGRIRSRYTLNNAQWGQDGEKMLEEGNTEVKELRDLLRVNSDLFIPVD